MCRTCHHEGPLAPETDHPPNYPEVPKSNYNPEEKEDKPPIPYIVSLSTACTPNQKGGNFYVQKFGVLVINAEDTCIVHRADIEHGTTVHEINWEAGKPTRVHRGFSMLVTHGLASLWRERRDELAGTALYDECGKQVLSQERLDALPKWKRKKELRKYESRNRSEYFIEDPVA
jgi:hypothetical protein